MVFYVALFLMYPSIFGDSNLQTSQNKDGDTPVSKYFSSQNRSMIVLRGEGRLKAKFKEYSVWNIKG